MNLYFLIWSFGLGVLAGLIVAVLRDEYRRRKLRRIEAEGVAKIRYGEPLGFALRPSKKIRAGEILLWPPGNERWP
jgi:hypothetical protein